ncbi:MAG: flagellar FliJ family protein [Phycisphaerae bacterium]|nr:flagellar FliJ family protein [Phycisphaerae bacterium]
MPVKFRFNLETVLDARRRVERERQRVVAALEMERLRIESRILLAQREIAAGREEVRAMADCRGTASITLDMVDIRRRAHLAGGQMMLIHRLSLELGAIMRRLQRARADLLEAARSRRGVEILRERRWTEWTDRVRRAESGELDELSVMRWGRDDQGARRSAASMDAKGGFDCGATPYDRTQEVPEVPT